MMEIGDEPISSIMNRSVEVIQEDSPIDDILNGCFDRKTTDLIVVDSEKRYLGVITAFEILSYINPFMGIHTGRKTMDHPLVMGHHPIAGEVMTPSTVTILENTKVKNALKHMRKDHHRYLVVLDKGRRVIGKLDLSDILGFLVDKGIIRPSGTEKR